MSNSSARDGNIARLHPAIRESVKKIQDKLQKENIPFHVLEAFRTPERQRNLYAQGRTKPGNVVTWAKPWSSIHQYGLAVDFVLKIDGKWSWDDQGAEAKYWVRMHELAKEHGMTPIFNKKGKLLEKPHIQMVGISSSQLRQGIYPDGGDAIWAEHLAELIDNWSGSPKAPPKPALAPQRPALDPADVAEMAAATGDVSTDEPAAFDPSELEQDETFQKLHSFVRRWEGGYVNHPRDKGGPTNMGITLKTLAAWRGTDVTAEDVKALLFDEADAIFRTNYYRRTRCGEMPQRTAMVVYNAAVLHGPKRAVEFLQGAFNGLGLRADGAPLEVDGVIGRKTMAAAQKTDSDVLSAAYLDLQETYFRQHDDFDVFGDGWLNRLAALREFNSTLPQGAGLRPKSDMKIADTNDDLNIMDLIGKGADVLKGGADRKAVLASVVAELLEDKDGDDDASNRRRALARMLLGDRLGLEPDADGKKPLTPVNAALGEGLGRLLDGKKSVIGIVGILLVVLLPESGLSGWLVEFLSMPGAAETATSTPGSVVAGAAETVKGKGVQVLTVLSLFTGWGFLGKIDKAVRFARRF